MLASMRAELLVLRKWPAAWGLLLVTPLLVLSRGYVAEFIAYLTLTPADYLTAGTPAQNLPSLLPSQFNIIAVNQFTFSGTAPFIILGAVMAGGDWGRGTIATALLQRPGRVRTFAGQALALAVAVTASVLASFAVAAAASLAVLAAESKSATPYAAAMPPALVIAESAGAALLVALTYAMLGLFLGTVCRSGAGAIAAGLLWTLIVESTLYNLALQFPQGILRTISDLTPGAAANVVTGLFGTPGGGASSSNYLVTGTTQAIWTLAAYLAAALALTVLVLLRRDAVTEPSRRLRFRRRRPAAAPAARPALPAAQRRPRPAADGVLASLLAELLVMSKRPAVWALVLIAPAEMLLNSYFTAYVDYATANTGITGVSAPQALSIMMPGQFLTAALNGAFGVVDPDSQVHGAVVFMLLGALIGGSDWDRSTIKTALLQGPTRLRTYAGQALAVAIAVAASVALTFALAAAASAAVALHLAGSPDPAGSQFPVLGHLAAALAAALIMCLAYAAVGLTLGIWLRSATAGIAAVLLWAVVIQPSIEQFATQLHGAVLRLYDILPDAATNTVANLAGSPNLYGTSYSVAQIAPALAFLTFGLYAAAFLTVPALITRRRDIL